MNIKRRYFALAGAAAAAIGLSLGAAGAAGATANQLTLPVAYPQGVAMDALGWAGTNTSASCAAHSANTFAYVGVWKSTGAGCASQFRLVPLTVGATAPGPNGPFEILYAPNGVAANVEASTGVSVSDGFCVSTYANSQGTFARIKHCAATLTQNTVTGLYSAAETTANAWQNFQSVGNTVDNPGAMQIQDVASGLCLNDKAFGGNGSHVISWTCTPPRANEAWTTPDFG